MTKNNKMQNWLIANKGNFVPSLMEVKPNKMQQNFMKLKYSSMLCWEICLYFMKLHYILLSFVIFTLNFAKKTKKIILIQNDFFQLSLMPWKMDESWSNFALSINESSQSLGLIFYQNICPMSFCLSSQFLVPVELKFLHLKN